jgi:hypothetical protein
VAGAPSEVLFGLIVVLTVRLAVGFTMPVQSGFLLPPLAATWPEAE